MTGYRVQISWLHRNADRECGTGTNMTLNPDCAFVVVNNSPDHREAKPVSFCPWWNRTVQKIFGRSSLEMPHPVSRIFSSTNSLWTEAFHFLPGVPTCNPSGCNLLPFPSTGLQTHRSVNRNPAGLIAPPSMTSTFRTHKLNSLMDIERKYPADGQPIPYMGSR